MNKLTIFQKQVECLQKIFKLKPYTIVFLLAQFFDFLTTYIGLAIGRMEGNPYVYMYGWEKLLTLKLLVCLIVFLYFQLRITKPRIIKFFWIITILASLPPAWNFGLILRTVLV